MLRGGIRVEFTDDSVGVGCKSGVLVVTRPQGLNWLMNSCVMDSSAHEVVYNLSYVVDQQLDGYDNMRNDMPNYIECRRTRLVELS